MINILFLLVKLLSITITTPNDGEIVNGIVKIQANVSNAVEVNFSIDGVPLGSVYSKPYRIFWDSETIPSGHHAITVGSKDSNGNWILTAINIYTE